MSEEFNEINLKCCGNCMWLYAGCTEFADNICLDWMFDGQSSEKRLKNREEGDV